MAALTEAKRKQSELAHRVLRVLVRQETQRKVGFTLSREEEQLMAQLEGVAAELATPTQFRGRLHELLSCVRLQSQNPGETPLIHYWIVYFTNHGAGTLNM